MEAEDLKILEDLTKGIDSIDNQIIECLKSEGITEQLKISYISQILMRNKTENITISINTIHI